MASAEFRDELTDSLDAEIHDLGDCFLKHFDAPVRAFRLGQANTAAPASTTAVDPAGVAVAVLPFAVLASDKRAHFAGDALADDVIAGLSREPRLRVLSPLSTRPFGHLPDATAGGAEQDVLERLRLHLHVSYVVTGRCAVAGDALKLQAQLIDARSGAILWADSARSTVDAVLMDAGGLVDEVVAAIGHHILDNELRRARSLPFQSLDNYSLYWSGVTLLNRLSRSDFDRSRGAFDQLAERQPRNAAPLAMSARWHVLRMMQGWAPSFNDEAEHARALARRALAIDRDNALGLAVDGLVSAHVDGDLDVALARCRSAVAADAQDPYAWMMLSGVLSYLGRGEEAVPAAEHAIALSPLDPALFQYEAYLAMALLSAHRFEEAAESAAASHRRNATLTGSLRIRIIALDGAARFDEARRLAAHMLHLQPGYTVAQYLRRYPGRHSQHAESYAEALRRAGIPP